KCYNFCRSRAELRVIYSNYPNLTARKIKMHYGGLCSAYFKWLCKSSLFDVQFQMKILLHGDFTDLQIRYYDWW
ncbi:MAG: hypothetical protein LBQ71_10775, partial [Hungatella sp.]|nr:hypothetical protein [Hungatella sp.]